MMRTRDHASDAFAAGVRKVAAMSPDMDRADLADTLGLTRRCLDEILGPEAPPVPRPAEGPSAVPSPTPAESADSGGAAADPCEPPRDHYRGVGRWSLKPTIPIGMAYRLFDGPLPPARTCQFFITENHLGPDAKKCGERSVEGYSYCQLHKAITHTGVPKIIGGTFKLPR